MYKRYFSSCREREREEDALSYARRKDERRAQGGKETSESFAGYFPVLFLCVTIRHVDGKRGRGEYRTLYNLLHDGHTRAKAAYCEIRTGYFSATGDTGVSALRRQPVPATCHSAMYRYGDSHDKGM